MEDEAEHIPLRRAALEALASVRDEAFEKDLPRWFHHSSQYLRSSAVTATGGYDPTSNPYTGCLIGVIRNEKESLLAYDTALAQLRTAAKGLQTVSRTVEGFKRLDRPSAMRAARQLFEAGEAHGETRATFAEAWFAWWAQDRGLGEDAAEGCHWGVVRVLVPRRQGGCRRRPRCP